MISWASPSRAPESVTSSSVPRWPPTGRIARQAAAWRPERSRPAGRRGQFRGELDAWQVLESLRWMACRSRSADRSAASGGAQIGHFGVSGLSGRPRSGAGSAGDQPEGHGQDLAAQRACRTLQGGSSDEDPGVVDPAGRAPVARGGDRRGAARGRRPWHRSRTSRGAVEAADDLDGEIGTAEPVGPAVLGRIAREEDGDVRASIIRRPSLRLVADVAAGEDLRCRSSGPGRS